MFFRPINTEIKTSMKAETARFYTTYFIAIAAAIVFITGCAETKGNANHTSGLQLSEGVIGDPGVTVIGVGVMPDEKRDMAAQIARRYVSSFLNWSDQAVYIVKRRTSNGYDLGWTIDVCKVIGHDEFGQPRFHYDERRTITLNRKEHIVDFDSPGPAGDGASGPGNQF